MHPSSTLQGSSAKSSSIRPNGLGGNTPVGVSFNKYAGPNARRLSGPKHALGVLGGGVSEPGAVRRTDKGDVCWPLARLNDGSPRAASAGFAEGKTSPCWQKTTLRVQCIEMTISGI